MIAKYSKTKQEDKSLYSQADGKDRGKETEASIRSQ